MIDGGTHEVRNRDACAYYNGVSWEQQIDVIVDALHASHISLDMTAPSLLRVWGKHEDRRCLD